MTTNDDSDPVDDGGGDTQVDPDTADERDNDPERGDADGASERETGVDQTDESDSPAGTDSPDDDDDSADEPGQTTEGESSGADTADGEETSRQPAGRASRRERNDRPSELRLEEVDRVFTVLEEALDNDALSGRQFERLLTVLERGVASPSETSPEEVAEFVTLLEELIVEPDDIDNADIDGLLSVFEDALSGTQGTTGEGTEDMFAVISEALRDPTRVDPEDVERFSSGIEQTIQSMTGSEQLGRLFGFPATGSVAERDGDTEVDPFRLAQVAAGMTQRASGYSVQSGVRTGTRMAYAAANAQSPADLLTATRAIALDELQQAGIDIGDEREDWLQRHEDEAVDRHPVTRERLRERGERLLSKSAELGRDETFHPAFASMLDQLASDEARILRLLATEGPQPTVDVLDKRYIPFKTSLVAENLSRVGSDAGCRRPERTQLYVTNLERLGLIRFEDDPIEDLKEYQVLEAQSHIEAAQTEAKRPKTTYGRMRLTDLGIDFCETCLPVSVENQRPTARFWETSPANTE